MVFRPTIPKHFVFHVSRSRIGPTTFVLWWFSVHIYKTHLCCKVSSSAVQKKQWFWYLLWWTFSNVGYVRVYIKRALFWATWPCGARVCQDEVLTTQDHGPCRCTDSNTCDWNRSAEMMCIVTSWLAQPGMWCVILLCATRRPRTFGNWMEPSLSTPPLGRASSAPHSWVLAPSHKTCFLTKKTRRKILGRFSEDSQKIVSRLRLLLPLTRRIGRFVFWYVFFFTRFVCVSIGDWFSVCWVGGERDEGSGGRGGGGGERSGFGGLSQVHCPVLSSILSFQSVLEHFCKFLKPYH